MTWPLLRAVLLVVPCALVATLSGLTAEPHNDNSPDKRGPDGRLVRKYTREWTDDYHNYHKEVYTAYTRTLKTEKGIEVLVEVRHGPATSFHRNGRKFWEGVYRDGEREGEFTTWSREGIRTGLASYEHGQLHGLYTQWADDGRKMREETYAKGKLNGAARWWDTDGKLLVTGTYRDGRPWSGKFIDLESSATETRRFVRTYEGGIKVGEERLTRGWWW
jgi:hypothetical protein